MNLIMLGATCIDGINEAEEFLFGLMPCITDGYQRAKLIRHIRRGCALQRAEVYRRSMYNMYSLSNHVQARRYMNLMNREFQVAADWSE